jgi:hypothetical protein
MILLHHGDHGSEKATNSPKASRARYQRQAGASLRLLLTGAAITIQQVHALKKPAHGEIPEVAADRTADGQNDDVDRMILAAPPQHPADPEDRESHRGPFQSHGLIHERSPAVFRWLTSDAIISDAAAQHRELHHAVLEPGSFGAFENLFAAECVHATHIAVVAELLRFQN